MEVLRWGYRVPFISTPPLSPALIPLQLFSNLNQAESSAGGDRDFNRQRGSRAGPSISRVLQSPFVVQKASGAWRPVIDLSAFNKFIKQMKFRMESNKSVLRAVKRFDWMISIDLKDAYLQVSMHLES